MVNKTKFVAIENELEGNKQNSRLLWKVLKSVRKEKKTWHLGEGGIKQINLTSIRLYPVIYCRQPAY